MWAFAAILCAAGCTAQEAEAEEPALELTGRVVDAAEILTPQTELELTAALSELERNTKVQLVIATTPSLDGMDIADYSLDLARAWAIGDATRNDGLLVLVAPNERKIRIEVGYGLEASVEDDEASEIIKNLVLPHFRQGDYGGGLTKGVAALAEEVTPIPLLEAA